MRDINRIDPFLDKLRELWMQNPDLRFGQIIEIIKSKVDCDLFYVEDDVIENVIKVFQESTNY